MFIDTHCHIHDRDTYNFALSRQQISKKSLARDPNIPHQPQDFTPEKLLARAKAQHVTKIIVIGTSAQDSLAAKNFATTHENVFYSYGIHPDSAEAPEFAMPDGRNGGSGPRQSKPGPRPDEPGPRQKRPHPLVAIGEIGLDYRNGTEAKSAQIALLERMLQLATDHNLPCIFHVREAFADFFPIVDNFPKLAGRAVVHSFSDSPENFEKSLNRGFYIGINGLATFADLYPKTLPPLDRTLLETDAPFLAPVPFRGRVNEPAYIPKIAAFLAEKHHLPLEEIAKQTTKNAETLFDI